jgi:hypothetical protein
MRRVQVDLHALSFVGGDVVNGTTDEWQLERATTETQFVATAASRAGGQQAILPGKPRGWRVEHEASKSPQCAWWWLH